MMQSRRDFLATTLAATAIVATPSAGLAQAAPSNLPSGFNWEVKVASETFWITQALIDSKKTYKKAGTFPWQRFSIADAPQLIGAKALRSYVSTAGVIRVSLDHFSPLVPIDPARFPDAFMLEVDHWIEKDTGSLTGGGKEWALQIARGFAGDTFLKSDLNTHGRDGTVLNVMRPRYPRSDSGADSGNNNRYGCYATDNSGTSSSTAAKTYFEKAGVGVTDHSHYFGKEWKASKGFVARPVQEWLKVQAYTIPNPQAGESTFTVRYIRSNGQIVVATKTNRVNPFFYGPQQCKVFFAHLRDMDGGDPEKGPSRWAGGSYMRNVRLLTAYRS